MHLKSTLDYPMTNDGSLPLLKWPGGKRALVAAVTSIFPEQFGKYFEPFLGGGAIFFALNPGKAILSDVNSDLIETYNEVKNNPTDVIARLRKLKNSEKAYYEIRSFRPEHPTDRAARFMYLCSLSFNGIHRYNLKGEFNVPYGQKTHLNICDEARIFACSERLRTARLIAADFATVISKAKANDLVYLDPPYTVAHNNNGFVKYNKAIFSWQDQERLAFAAEAARQRGCFVVVSNADHESVRALYPHFAYKTISRHSVIASAPAHRKTITEGLFWADGRV